MSKLFLLFSHTLTDEQTTDARETLGVKDIISLPGYLQNRWSDFPPGLKTINEHLRPILVWLSEQAVAGDYVLIQGDFGAVYLSVTFAFEIGLIPLYATTERHVVELPQPDGSVQVRRRFRHVCFRKYARQPLDFS